MLGISIGFNSLSTHGACTAIFVAVAAVIGFSCGSIQTLGKVSWIAWVGVFGILTAGKHIQVVLINDGTNISQCSRSLSPLACKIVQPRRHRPDHTCQTTNCSARQLSLRPCRLSQRSSSPSPEHQLSSRSLLRCATLATTPSLLSLHKLWWPWSTLSSASSCTTSAVPTLHRLPLDLQV